MSSAVNESERERRWEREKEGKGERLGGWVVGRLGAFHKAQPTCLKLQLFTIGREEGRSCWPSAPLRSTPLPFRSFNTNNRTQPEICIEIHWKRVDIEIQREQRVKERVENVEGNRRDLTVISNRC